MRRPLFSKAAVVAAFLVSHSAFAGCAPNQTELMTCTFQEGAKQVTACLDTQIVSYAFGPQQGPPDLGLLRGIEHITYRPWNGIGRAIYEEFSLQNNDITYTLYSTLDRLSPEPELEGGIVVTENDKELAHLICDKSSVSQGIEALYETFEAAGLCWNRETFEWAKSCPN